MAKKQTYADRAKKIMSKYKPRLGENFDKGDTLALEAMNQELTALQQEQEQARAQKQVQEQQFQQQTVEKFQNGGTLTKRERSTLSALIQGQNAPISSPRSNQRPTVADVPEFRGGGRMYRGGGSLPKYQFGTNLGRTDGYNFNTGAGIAPDATFRPDLNYFNPYTGGQVSLPGAQQGIPGGFSMDQRLMLGANQDMNTLGTVPMQAPTLSLNQPTGLGPTPNPTAQTQQQQQQQGGDAFSSRVPWFGAAAQGLGAILANRQLDLPTGLEGVEDVTPQQVAARQVDYSRSREQIGRERDRAQTAIRRAARGRGTQQGLTGATIAGATETQRVAGQQFTQSQEGEANQNAQIKNQVGMFNAQQRARAAETNLRSAMLRGQYDRENELINAQRKDQQISGLLGAVTGYGQDLMSADRYDQMLNIMTPENYEAFASDDSKFRRLMQISPEMAMRFRSTGDRTATKT